MPKASRKLAKTIEGGGLGVNINIEYYFYWSTAVKN